MSQPRIFFAMSRDGLLPAARQQGAPALRHALHHDHHHRRRRGHRRRPDADPDGRRDDVASGRSSRSWSSARRCSCCGSKRPDARRPFRVPFGSLFPVLGIISCLYLMLSLPVITWVRFLVWLDLGIVIYWFYGRAHSPLVDQRGAGGAHGARRRWRTSSRCSAASVMFNGFFMTVLGYMTEFGITNENTAKWHEIDVTPQQADIVGLAVLGVGRGGAGRGPGDAEGDRRALADLTPPSAGRRSTPRARPLRRERRADGALLAHRARSRPFDPAPRRPASRRSRRFSLRWWLRPERLTLLLFATVFVGGHARLRRSSRAGPPWDAFYMTVITVTTVGYREVHPHVARRARSSPSPCWSAASARCSTRVTLFVARLVESGLSHRWEERRRARMIDELDNHFIVCGYGRIGRIIVEELRRQGVPLRRHRPRPGAGARRSSRPARLAVAADASNEDVLRRVGIDRARGLIAAVGHRRRERLHRAHGAPAAARPLHRQPRRDRDAVSQAEAGRRQPRHLAVPDRRAAHRADRAPAGGRGLRPARDEFARRSNSRWSRSKVAPAAPLAGHSLRRRQRAPAVRRHRRRAPARRGSMEFNPSPDRRLEAGDELRGARVARDSLKRFNAEAQPAAPAEGLTMSARVLDGTAVATQIRDELRPRVAAFTRAAGRPPGLGIVLVGDDPASHVYVRNKIRAGHGRRVPRRPAAPAGDDDARRGAGRRAAAQPQRRRTTASSCSRRCRRRWAPTPSGSIFDAIDAVEGRRRVQPGQRRPAGAEARRACAPARRPGVMELLDRSGIALRGAARRRHRPQRHRRQADGADAAAPRRDGDDLPLADGATCRRVARDGRHPGRRDRARRGS